MSDARSGGGEGARFELTMSIPRDARYAATVRELALHAAKYAGCSDVRAQAFAREVEEATRGSIDAANGEAGLPLVFRQSSSAVEVLVNGRTLSAEP